MSLIKWWCVNCEQLITIDQHGRCECCGSSAVCDPVPVVNVPVGEALTEMLEELWRS